MTTEPSRTPAADEPKGKIFIPYSRKDSSAFADELVTALRKSGYLGYIDAKDIKPGEAWQDWLAALVRQADAIVFVVSSESVRSEFCAWEVSLALQLGKRIIPAVHVPVDGAAMPAALSRLNLLFMADAGAFHRAMPALIEAIETDLPWVRDHTRLGEKAAEWDTNGRRSSDLLRGPALERAEAWIAAHPGKGVVPTDVQRAYIATGRRDATRYQRSVAAVMGVVAVILAGLLGGGRPAKPRGADPSRRDGRGDRPRLRLRAEVPQDRRRSH